MILTIHREEDMQNKPMILVVRKSETGLGVWVMEKNDCFVCLVDS